MAAHGFDAKEALVALREKMMPFQREGVDFMVKAGGRALLADEMGLGKSLQAIALALEFSDDWPLLVIAPASMRYSWAAELEKWLPRLPPSAVSIARGRSDVAAVTSKGTQIAIVTYSLLTGGRTHHARYVRTARTARTAHRGLGRGRRGAQREGRQVRLRYRRRVALPPHPRFAADRARHACASGSRTCVDVHVEMCPRTMGKLSVVRVPA